MFIHRKHQSASLLLFCTLCFFCQCNFDDPTLQGTECTPDDEVPGGFTCEEGHLVASQDNPPDLSSQETEPLLDAGVPQDSATVSPPDSDRDAACDTRTEEELCEAFNTSCGPLNLIDDCGTPRAIEECGPCGMGELCQGSACLPECDGETATKLCIAADFECGELTTIDACDTPRVVQCGPCEEAETCSEDHQCVCEPKDPATLCHEANARCDTIEVDDGCGELVDVPCGSCQAQEICTNHTCMCVPLSEGEICQRDELKCDTHMADNGCGQLVTVTCGTCDDDEVCNAAAQCECPTPSCDNVACGQVGNLCGNTVSCLDTCDATTQRCSRNSCQCKPETNAELCAAYNGGLGAECGTISVTDRCGTPRSHITCPNTCGAGETCNNATKVCECPQPVCQPNSCESVSNLCGNVRSCSCSPGFQCTLTQGGVVCEPNCGNGMILCE